MKKFDKSYWDKNYSEPMTMDGIGYAHLFREMLKAFIPHRAVGIQPSPYAFKKARLHKLRPVESTDLQLLEEDILTWCRTDRKKMICLI